MCQALPTLRHWCVKRCFLHQPCPQARQALINHPLVTDVSSFISLASRACQALLSLPAWRHGYVKLCCFLPAWRHWHVRLCFLYQPGVTGMSSFAFFTSLAWLACQALLSLPAWRHWHVKLCFTTGVSLASNAVLLLCICSCDASRYRLYVAGLLSFVLPPYTAALWNFVREIVFQANTLLCLLD